MDVIQIMRKVNLRGVDLNLLVVLQALLKHRHVTQAAETLNMSQPAVSRALGRLRDTFNDPLLVRTTQGFDLSARALDLQPQLEQVLAAFEKMVSSPQFDPGQSREVVKIYGLDPDVSMIIPELFAVLRREAPSMTLDVRSEPMDQFELLDAGEVHFSLSAFTPEAGMGQYRRIKVATPDFVVIMHRDHPLANQPLTLQAYLGAEHAMVSITGRGPAIIDKAIAEYGARLNTVVRLSSFSNVAQFCEAGRVLFQLPRRLAEETVKGRPLVIREPPQELGKGPDGFFLYWHERHHFNPMCRWVREKVRGILVARESEEG